jgi:hypothetical protein
VDSSAGVDSASEQYKSEARKLLENGNESHLSTRSVFSGGFGTFHNLKSFNVVKMDESLHRIT